MNLSFSQFLSSNSISHRTVGKDKRPQAIALVKALVAPIEAPQSRGLRRHSQVLPRYHLACGWVHSVGLGGNILAPQDACF